MPQTNEIEQLIPNREGIVSFNSHNHVETIRLDVALQENDLQLVIGYFDSPSSTENTFHIGRLSIERLVHAALIQENKKERIIAYERLADLCMYLSQVFRRDAIQIKEHLVSEDEGREVYAVPTPVRHPSPISTWQDRSNAQLNNAGRTVGHIPVQLADSPVEVSRTFQGLQPMGIPSDMFSIEPEHEISF